MGHLINADFRMKTCLYLGLNPIPALLTALRMVVIYLYLISEIERSPIRCCTLLLNMVLKLGLRKIRHKRCEEALEVLEENQAQY